VRIVRSLKDSLSSSRGHLAATKTRRRSYPNAGGVRPGSAQFVGRVLKDGEKWTLILVQKFSTRRNRSGRPDPTAGTTAHEWLLLVTDGILVAVGTVNLTWVGTPKPIETKVTESNSSVT